MYTLANSHVHIPLFYTLTILIIIIIKHGLVFIISERHGSEAEKEDQGHTSPARLQTLREEQFHTQTTCEYHEELTEWSGEKHTAPTTSPTYEWKTAATTTPTPRYDGSTRW